MRIPFVGPSYVWRSTNFDAQRSVNLFPSKSESGRSANIDVLLPTPGLTLHGTAATARCRGAWETLGRAFFVFGAKLYETLADGTVTALGNLTTDHGYVSMSDNGLELCLVDGTNGYLYIFAVANAITNGTFDADANWTKGAGWTIGSGHATGGSAISTAISQAPSTLTVGISYTVTYTITRSAGTITPALGGTAGTTRNSSGTYVETIVAGSSDKLLAFNTSGFTGTLDTVSVVQATDQFLQINDPYFLPADTVDFCNGRFLFNHSLTGQWFISALYDGSTGDPSEIATAEGSPDNLVAVKTVHNEPWLFGEESIEVWYDSGAAQFPFERVQGAFIEYGCAAKGSISKTANTVFWLGRDKQGAAMVWMAQGYQPTRISTEAIEQQLAGYSTLSDATSYTYQEDGHYFYVLNFTAANATWVYDVRLNAWHERAFWNKITGLYERHLAEAHVYAFGKHIVGDYNAATVYQMSSSLYDDNGDEIRRLRSSPHTFDEMEYLFYSKFLLDMETGLGNETGDGEDTDPQVILQWSDDGGHTWSSEHARPAGKVGEYRARALWRRLGRSRDRVFRVVYTGRTRFSIIGARIDVEAGTA